MNRSLLIPAVRRGRVQVAGRRTACSRHRLLAVLAALIALSAYGGGAGLISGSLDLGVTATARLPFHSPVIGGLALIAVVAGPSTALTWLAARGHRRTGDASIIAGILLVGWILIELAFIRELSFFQPLYVVLGMLLVRAGTMIRQHEAVRANAVDEPAT